MRKTIISGAAIAASVILIGATSGSSTDWVLPNNKITPGVINKEIKQSNIKTTICKSGWTTTIRPNVAYTNKLKTDQLAGSYKNHATIWGTSLSKYEEDHLISLQLGGSPDNPKNLWPQPYDGNNARKKDVIETKLKKMVCAGQIKLRDAQKAIATNWVDAYNKYTNSSDKPDSNTGD